MSDAVILGSPPALLNANARTSADWEAVSAEVTRVIDLARATLAGQVNLWWESDAQAQTRANLDTLAEQVDDWASRRRGWAEAGRRDDGTPYDAARWVSEGKTYADAAAYQTGTYANADVFKVIEDTVTASAGQIATGVEQAAHTVAAVVTSSVTPWVVGGALALVALAVLAPYVKALGKAAA